MAQLTHLLIVGQTLSGKTAYARRLVAGSTRIKSLVYDPTTYQTGQGVAGWASNAFVLNTWEAFHQAATRSRGCLLVIDEAASVSMEHRDDLRVLLTRGRHINPATGGGGHVVAMLSQRHRVIDKTCRDQCSALVAFNVNAKDAQDLAEDWNCPALHRLPQLPPLHYLSLTRHERPRAGILTF